jgi:hypothetical protein
MDAPVVFVTILLILSGRAPGLPVVQATPESPVAPQAFAEVFLSEPSQAEQSAIEPNTIETSPESKPEVAAEAIQDSIVNPFVNEPVVVDPVQASEPISRDIESDDPIDPLFAEDADTAVESNPATVEPAPADATPVDAPVIESTPAANAPVAEARVEAAPAEPIPVDVASVETTPAELAPVTVVPVETSPVESTPLESDSVVPAPLESAIIQSAPVESVQVESLPAEAVPVVPQAQPSQSVEQSTNPENVVEPSIVENDQIELPPQYEATGDPTVILNSDQTEPVGQEATSNEVLAPAIADDLTIADEASVAEPTQPPVVETGDENEAFPTDESIFVSRLPAEGELVAQPEAVDGENQDAIQEADKNSAVAQPSAEIADPITGEAVSIDADLQNLDIVQEPQPGVAEATVSPSTEVKEQVKPETNPAAAVEPIAVEGFGNIPAPQPDVVKEPVGEPATTGAAADPVVVPVPESVKLPHTEVIEEVIRCPYSGAYIRR